MLDKRKLEMYNKNHPNFANRSELEFSQNIRQWTRIRSFVSRLNSKGLASHLCSKRKLETMVVDAGKRKIQEGGVS